MAIKGSGMKDGSGAESGAEPGREDAVRKDGGGGSKALPLFYGAPRPLDSRRHASKRLRATNDLGFARRTNSIPLNGIEFLLAVKHYPIVFTASEPAVPVAVVGLRERENLYIRPDGSWETGAYVPAYVRRYPFIFLEHAGGGQFTLCIDEGSGALSNEEASPYLRATPPLRRPCGPGISARPSRPRRSPPGLLPTPCKQRGFWSRTGLR
jgi:hypothetical protein